MGWEAGPLVFGAASRGCRVSCQKICRWVLPIRNSKPKICTFKNVPKDTTLFSHFPKIPKIHRFWYFQKTNNTTLNLHSNKAKNTKSTNYTKQKEYIIHTRIQKRESSYPGPYANECRSCKSWCKWAQVEASIQYHPAQYHPTQPIPSSRLWTHRCPHLSK